MDFRRQRRDILHQSREGPNAAETLLEEQKLKYFKINFGVLVLCVFHVCGSIIHLINIENGAQMRRHKFKLEKQGLGDSILNLTRWDLHWGVFQDVEPFFRASPAATSLAAMLGSKA